MDLELLLIEVHLTTSARHVKLCIVSHRGLRFHDRLQGVLGPGPGTNSTGCLRIGVGLVLAQLIVVNISLMLLVRMRRC